MHLVMRFGEWYNEHRTAGDHGSATGDKLAGEQRHDEGVMFIQRDIASNGASVEVGKRRTTYNAKEENMIR